MSHLNYRSPQYCSAAARSSDNSAARTSHPGEYCRTMAFVNAVAMIAHGEDHHPTARHLPLRPARRRVRPEPPRRAGWDTQVPLRVRPDLRDDPAEGGPSAWQSAAGPPARAPPAPAPPPNPSTSADSCGLVAGATSDPNPSRTPVMGTPSNSADGCDLVASRRAVRPPSARATARPLDAVNAQMTCGGMLPSGARVHARVWSICR
jgi:hypothetical protein